MSEREFEREVAILRQSVARDPDLNLYLLAFDCPDLEEAALAIAAEMASREAA